MDRKDPLTLYEERLNAVDRRRWLHPMSASEIIESSARIYQLCARRILPDSFLYSVVAYFGLSFFAAFVLPTLFGINAGEGLRSDATRALLALVIGFGVAIPAGMFGISGGFAVAMEQAEPIVLGEKNRQSASAPSHPLRMTVLLTAITFISLSPVLFCAFLVGIGAWQETIGNENLAVLLGLSGWLLAFVAVPSTAVVFSRLALAPCAMLREKLGIGGAIRRSWLLTRGVKRIGGTTEATFYVLLIFLVLVGAIFAIVLTAVQMLRIQPPVDQFLNGAVWGQFGQAALSALPGFFVIWLLTPFLAIAATLMYFDRLIRLEAFDIRVLARDVMEVRG